MTPDTDRQDALLADLERAAYIEGAVVGFLVCATVATCVIGVLFA